MQVIGLARLGRDVEAPRQAGGSSVCNLSLAFSYGQKDQQTGNRPTQWVDASLWGKQAEAVHSYLMKGKLLYVTLDDVHIEEYHGRNGTGHKLVGKVTKLEFAGSSERQEDSQATAPRQAASPRPAPASAPVRQQPARNTAGFAEDDDSDVPFN